MLASNTVAMVTYCVTKMIENENVFTDVAQFSDTMIAASTDKEWL